MGNYEKLIKQASLYESSLHFLEEMLLYDRIKLSEIPQNIRVSHRPIYISAFRISRDESIPCDRFINDLELLCSDILSLDKRSKSRKNLIEVLFSQLNFNDHKGEKSFVDFKKNMPKDILYEMRRNRSADVNDLRTQLRKFKIKKVRR